MLENRRRLATALGVHAADFVHCRQVHGTGIAKVDWENAGAVMDGSDGLITDAVGLPLSLVFADCAPLLIYDPVHHALGVMHAGWRGTVNGAATALLWALQAAYDSDPAQVQVAIGPSIGPQSYEVGAEVVALATARLPDPDALFTYPNGAGPQPTLRSLAGQRSIARPGRRAGRTDRGQRHRRRAAHRRLLQPPRRTRPLRAVQHGGVVGRDRTRMTRIWRIPAD